MANPLTLLMPVVPNTAVTTLVTLIGKNQASIDAALTSIGTVHFARFLVLDTSVPNLQPPPTANNNLVLAVITEYDGDFDAYISDFVKQLGDVFNALLYYVVGGEPLIRVQDHLNEFQAFIKNNDYSQMTGAPSLYSAYPCTVQTILADCGSGAATGAAR